jgi:hypothetical protein
MHCSLLASRTEFFKFDLIFNRFSVSGRKIIDVFTVFADESYEVIL